MDIDWSKAPEWATGLGGVPFHRLWVNDEQYAYENSPSKVYKWANSFESISFRHRSELQNLTARPEKWNGTGLPPVGADFETCNRGDGNWRKAKMLFSGKELGVMRLDTCAEYSFYVDEWEYRPIRTPEQIAAEERTRAIDDLVKVTCINRGEAGRIYDAGYRKQVQP